jgi:circadian clock protein KaiC
VLIGSAREAQQLVEKAGVVLRKHALGRKDMAIERKRKVLEAKIASLQEEFETVKDELNKTHVEEEITSEIMARNRKEIMTSRQTKNTSHGKSK